MQKVEELRNATEEDLIQRANELLTAAHGAGFSDKPAYFLQAQLYLAEIERRHQNWISNRDYKMERWVIALIGVEIVVAVVGLVVAIIYGTEQTNMMRAEHDMAYRV